MWRASISKPPIAVPSLTYSGGGDKGVLTVRAVASRLLHNVFVDKDLVSGEETPFDNAREADNPKFRLALNANWQKGAPPLNWGSRFISGTVTDNDLADPQEDVGSFYHIPSLWLHDASLAYDTPFGLRLTAGGRNLFDTGPRDHSNMVRGSSACNDVVGCVIFSEPRFVLAEANTSILAVERQGLFAAKM